MSASYLNLKRKLEDLGYNYTLPMDAVPLVESLLADFLQTTRSLQHYMDLSKEALAQRDSLILQAEPYRINNANLIQECNQLHKEIYNLKEEHFKETKQLKRKIKAMTEELIKKDSLISKLQHDVRDLGLRSLCAGTQSSRYKSRRKDCGDVDNTRNCVCNEKESHNSEIIELVKKNESLIENNNALTDEIALLKHKVEHRDNEIIRLNILLESVKATSVISKDFGSSNSRLQDLNKQLLELEAVNEQLRKELNSGLEKQHEAMARALNLADKNKCLRNELEKVDALALKVEEDCNKRLASMMTEIRLLQNRLAELNIKNADLERQLSQKASPTLKLKESLEIAVSEKESLQKENKELLNLNKELQDKLLKLSQTDKGFDSKTNVELDKQKCLTKDELQILLDEERVQYEKHMKDTMSLFSEHFKKYKQKECSKTPSNDDSFIKELHNKLCESEQKILMLKKENNDLKSKIENNKEFSKQNFKETINQLNAENAELLKENIALSEKLSHYKHLNYSNKDSNCTKMDMKKLKEENERLRSEIQLLQKDKQEYNMRYKEAIDLVDKLKRDLAYKQKEVELLEEENCSYKMTNRSGKASVEHLREECDFLKEQIKMMQNDVIKEKTLASQIKHIQQETERSSNEIQNELLCTQKKMSMSKDTIDLLTKKCKGLQNEIITLKNENNNLRDNLRKIDQERDKLVIDLDHKTEKNNLLEQKLKSQSNEIIKLEKEIADLNRQLNEKKVFEHKVMDSETQIKYLNAEILKLTQQLDNAVMENKHLQSSLADLHGNLKVNKIEYDKSRKEVEGLKQQLQHYVAEIRRIEELLSQKEAERSDMLEQFASLSVEANILENTNHSLESESASKSMKLQGYVSKIQQLEEKNIDNEQIIDSQSGTIATLTCRVASLENEVKLVTEEKAILEQNITYLKQMCNNMNLENCNNAKEFNDTNSELKLYESRIKSLSKHKTNLEIEKDELRKNLVTTEKLLSNARREIVELKLALQDATSETKSLQERVGQMRRETTIHETSKEELELPLMLEETIHEVSHEEDEDSSRYKEVHKRFSRYAHGNTL